MSSRASFKDLYLPAFSRCVGYSVGAQGGWYSPRAAVEIAVSNRILYPTSKAEIEEKIGSSLHAPAGSRYSPIWRSGTGLTRAIGFCWNLAQRYRTGRDRTRVGVGGRSRRCAHASSATSHSRVLLPLAARRLSPPTGRTRNTRTCGRPERVPDAQGVRRRGVWLLGDYDTLVRSREMRRSRLPHRPRASAVAAGEDVFVLAEDRVAAVAGRVLKRSSSASPLELSSATAPTAPIFAPRTARRETFQSSPTRS